MCCIWSMPLTPQLSWRGLDRQLFQHRNYSFQRDGWKQRCRLSSEGTNTPKAPTQKETISSLLKAWWSSARPAMGELFRVQDIQPGHTHPCHMDSWPYQPLQRHWVTVGTLHLSGTPFLRPLEGRDEVRKCYKEKGWSRDHSDIGKTV